MWGERRGPDWPEGTSGENIAAQQEKGGYYQDAGYWTRDHRQASRFQADRSSQERCAPSRWLVLPASAMAAESTRMTAEAPHATAKPTYAASKSASVAAEGD